MTIKLVANNAENLYGLRYLIRGTTLPNLPGTNGTDLLNHHYSTWKSYVITAGAPYPDMIFSLAFQPMPVTIPAASQYYNPIGNTLSLSPNFGDHIWMEYDISWTTSLEDDAAHALAMNITATIDAYAETTYAGVKSSNYKGGDGNRETLEEEEYNPTFLNDAMYDQTPLQSYGRSNYEKLKAIQKSVDPEGFFPGRTGGFKYT